MVNFLTELEATSDAAARSLYLPPGLPLPETEHLLEQAISPAITTELTNIASSSRTGVSLFWGSAGKYLVSPPFPIAGKAFFQGYKVESLLSLLKTDFRIALILIRLRAYAIGICEGENLTTSKVGTALVHARHRKGGSSQQRFQRHREKQIEYFLTRVCQHVQEQLKSQALDYLVYGGAWTTILSLQKRCPFLQQLDNRLLPPLLDIHEPRQAVLEAAVSRVWASCIIEWCDT